MPTENNYVGYCETLVRGLCSRPDEVRVEKSVDERGVLLTIAVNSEDMRTIIGTKGDTASAIRRLVRVSGALEHAKVSIKILEPERRVDSEQNNQEM